MSFMSKNKSIIVPISLENDQRKKCSETHSLNVNYLVTNVSKNSKRIFLVSELEEFITVKKNCSAFVYTICHQCATVVMCKVKIQTSGIGKNVFFVCFFNLSI